MYVATSLLKELSFEKKLRNSQTKFVIGLALKNMPCFLCNIPAGNPHWLPYNLCRRNIFYLSVYVFML